MEFKKYTRKGFTEAAPWTKEFDMTNVEVASVHAAQGSPKRGDMIVYNEGEPSEMWLMPKSMFKPNYELYVEELPTVLFCHIGGYELLRDGTHWEEVDYAIDSVLAHIEGYEIELDKEYNDIEELLEVVEILWAERFNDGGGSGWIEQ